LRSLPRADNDDHPIRRTAEQLRLSTREDRRPIQHDQVIVPSRLVQLLACALQRRQVLRMGFRSLQRRDVEARHDGPVDGQVAHLVQAVWFGAENRVAAFRQGERRSDPGPPYVALDQQRAASAGRYVAR